MFCVINVEQYTVYVKKEDFICHAMSFLSIVAVIFFSSENLSKIECIVMIGYFSFLIAPQSCKMLFSVTIQHCKMTYSLWNITKEFALHLESDGHQLLKK